MGEPLVVVALAGKAERFQQIVDSAAQQLAAVRHRADGSYITTPLIYASGSYVVVRVEPVAEGFMVSDFGLGMQEAEMLGGEMIFRRNAQTIADRAGIKFDHHAFFAVLAAEERLPGAIATVANCSQEAVTLTAMKIAERKQRDDAEILYERLADVFTKQSVTKDAELVGASNTAWSVTSLVSLGRSQVAFEAVANHPNSVAFATMKFRDLALLEKPPGRIAVVNQKKQFGTYLGLLAQTSNVIEFKVEDEALRAVTARAA